MRLTCPRCGAQYEIPEAVIPTGGREVECSACGNVWHQPAPAAAAPRSEIAAKSPDRPQVAAPPPAEASRPAEPAKLNRKLDDDVLAILREEAERELSARAREAKVAVAQDHNPVSTSKNATEVSPEAPKPAADETDFDWPVSTVILPGEPLDSPASPAPAGVSAAPTEASPDPVAPPPRQLEPQQPEPAVLEPVASITDPEPEAATQPERQATLAAPPEGTSPPEPAAEPTPRPRLPDAARLAATLTRPLPQAALTPPATPQLAEAGVVTATSRPAQVPALRAPTPRKGYAAGFGLAAMLAVALVASYALAPRVEPGAAAGPLAEWRQNMDRARLWLHDLVRSTPDA